MLYTYEQPLATRHPTPAWLSLFLRYVLGKGLRAVCWSPNLLYPVQSNWNDLKFSEKYYLFHIFAFNIQTWNQGMQLQSPKKIVKVIFLVHFWESLQNLLIEILKLKKRRSPMKY